MIAKSDQNLLESLEGRFVELLIPQAAEDYLGEVFSQLVNECELSWPLARKLRGSYSFGDVWEKLKNRVLSPCGDRPTLQTFRALRGYIKTTLRRHLYTVREKSTSTRRRESGKDPDVLSSMPDTKCKTPLEALIEKEEQPEREMLREAIEDALRGKTPSVNVADCIKKIVEEEIPTKRIGHACSTLGVRKVILFGFGR